MMVPTHSLAPESARDDPRGLMARPPRLEASIAWLAVSGLVLLLSAIAVLSLQLRTRTLAEAESRAADAAGVLAEHAARVFDAADLLVLRAAEESRGVDWDVVERSTILWNTLRDQADRFPFLDALWLNDATGRLRLTTIALPTPETSAADRDFFRAHLGGSDRPYVSELIVGRVTGRPTFLLSRRLDDGAGLFRGIASVTVDADYFTTFYRRVDLPYRPRIVLFRTQGPTPLVAHPDNDHPSYRPNGLEPALATLLEQQPLGGIAWTDEAIIAHRTLPNWPVGVAVSLDRDSIAAGWWGSLWPYLLPAAAGAVALVGLAVFAFGQARAARSLQHALERRVGERTASLEAALVQRDAALAEKDLLMRESNHRIKNSLQVVSSILSLQAANVADPEVRRHLGEAGRRVRAVSDIHQLLYRVQDMQAVPFHEYLSDLCRELERSMPAEGGTWRLDLNADAIHIATDRAVPLGLIVNELVMNAVKHAYPGDGAKPIRVSFLREGEGRIRLSVADQGIGLPAGFEWKRSRSLGMRVIFALSAQLGATIEVAATHPGAAFTITMPITAADAAADVLG